VIGLCFLNLNCRITHHLLDLKIKTDLTDTFSHHIEHMGAVNSANLFLCRDFSFKVPTVITRGVMPSDDSDCFCSFVDAFRSFRRNYQEHDVLS